MKQNNIHGCTDGYCAIKGKAKGMHTNGGCRCVQNILRENTSETMKRIALERAFRMLHDRIEELEETNKTLEDK